MTAPYYAAAELDLIAESQSGKATAANNLLAALSSAALFGVKSVSGLNITLYGGNMVIAGEPTPIANQTLACTANTTNYIYSTSAGVATKTTSIPSGWPGPLAAGAIALYTLIVGASTITSGTCYVPSLGTQGDPGTTGADGPAGSDFFATRKRIASAIGSSSTTVHVLGFSALTLTGTSASARTLASSSLRESIPYVGYESGAGAGSSLQIHHDRNFCYLGDAAGRGGFTFSVRFCIENSLNASPANQRCFIGLIPVPGTLANAEPDQLANIMGIGANAGDANFSVMHNDASGTATKSTLGANFPARATDNVYELTLSSVANSGVVSYSLTDAATGNNVSSTFSSDIPANTVFLSFVIWFNNGSTAVKTSVGIMQIVGETRY